MIYPNLYIIGAPKCGTTSLAHYISQHKDIFVPKIKELYFFIDDNKYLKGTKYFSEFKIEKTKYFCDATPVYMQNSDIVIPRIKETIPSFERIKIVILLRDPIERIYSHYLHNARTTLEKRSLNESIEEELKLISNNKNNDQKTVYIAPSFYGSLMKNWLHEFPKNNIFIGQTEKLKKHNKKFMKELYEFLAVKPIYNIEEKYLNVASVPRSHLLMRLLNCNFAVKKILKSFVPEYRRKLLRDFLISLNLKKIKKEETPLSLELKDKLKSIYLKDIELAQQFVELELSYWKNFNTKLGFDTDDKRVSWNKT